MDMLYFVLSGAQREAPEPKAAHVRVFTQKQMRDVMKRGTRMRRNVSYLQRVTGGFTVGDGVGGGRVTGCR